MSTSREVTKLMTGRRTSDGAGVKLNRMFSEGEAEDLDPFLLLDMFGSDRSEDYAAGFPTHPHRGIETVTYMLDGYMDHRDSLGNQGTIGPGDVQWMTAGSGILHEEMPRGPGGSARGIQLWVNLPRASKMMPPRYRAILAKEIPVVDMGRGSVIKVISGVSEGKMGPVRDLAVDVKYLDVHLSSRTVLEHETEGDRNAFIMVYEGSFDIGANAPVTVRAGNVAVLGPGDTVKVSAGKRPSKLIYVSGRPLGEPIAWGGPIVMNSKEELEQAFLELKKGTFIRDA
ncbi:MAG: pirin family protein [Methanomassiliicoccales archaeon]|nr:pirin family protein [Methanomassiliicoccales archaeon]